MEAIRAELNVSQARSPGALRQRRTRAALGLVLGAMVAGCIHPGPQDPARVGPFFVPSNVMADTHLAGIRRVVVLPAWSGQVIRSESAATLDAIVATAVQRENRFEVVTLTREQCRRWFGVDAIASTAALPSDLLGRLQREFAAQGVLFVDVTAHQAYPPLMLGLRAKLATVEGPRIVWAFDHVFSADDAAVANAARRFLLDREREGVPADFTRVALQSPSRFASYATAAMFETLPPVVPMLRPRQ